MSEEFLQYKVVLKNERERMILYLEELRARRLNKIFDHNMKIAEEKLFNDSEEVSSKDRQFIESNLPLPEEQFEIKVDEAQKNIGFVKRYTEKVIDPYSGANLCLFTLADKLADRIGVIPYMVNSSINYAPVMWS